MTRHAHFVLAFLLGLPVQAQTEAPLVDRLRDIANRRITTDAAVTQRQADAAQWLADAAAHDLGERAILCEVARNFLADKTAARAGAQALLAYYRDHERLPAPGFEDAAGRAALFEVVAFADAQDWDTCQRFLPVLLRTAADRQSVWWLLGRRARDAGTEAGRVFLQKTVIPGLLVDPGLQDFERVHQLRRLYDVEYTGPLPFVDIAGPDLDGKQVRTADHRGRVLLVDYWATWCVPCLMAMPGVVAAYQRFHDQGFDVVAISVDEQSRRERVVAKVKELGMTFPVVFDGKGPDSEIVLANEVLAYPTSFLIDRKGRVRYSGLEGEELARRVAELLAEK